MELVGPLAGGTQRKTWVQARRCHAHGRELQAGSSSRDTVATRAPVEKKQHSRDTVGTWWSALRQWCRHALDVSRVDLERTISSKRCWWVGGPPKSRGLISLCGQEVIFTRACRRRCRRR